MPESNGYLRPEILARIVPLGLRASRIVEGTIAGQHRSPLHGLSVEFADYREYVPGDDLKRLDWRAYARSDRFFIKQYEEESNLRGTLLVDASASMRYGRGAMSKFDYAATLAASLATLLVRQRDAAGLAVFDESERLFLPPAATNMQLAKIIDALESSRPERTTDLGSTITRLVDKIKARGMVFVISDLLTDLERFYDGLGRLQSRGHEIIVFHVLDRDELELPFEGSVMFRDLEGDDEVFAEPWFFQRAYRTAMKEFCTKVESRCRSCGMDYLLLATDSDLALALSHYLHRRQVTLGARRVSKMSAMRHTGAASAGEL